MKDKRKTMVKKKRRICAVRAARDADVFQWSNVAFTGCRKDQQRSLPEDVGQGEAAGGGQAPPPAGVSVLGGPHLNDDKGQHSCVLEHNTTRVNTHTHIALQFENFKLFSLHSILRMP